VNFVDLIAQQKEWAFLLGSDEQLDRINIATRDYIVANESRLPDKTLAAEVLAYITIRNGRKGCGIIVERPVLRIPQGVSPGPQKVLLQEFLVLEERGINEGPITGTGLHADWVAQRILELGHHHYIEGIGDFYADPNSVQFAADFEPLNAWRVQLLVNLETQTPQRLTAPAISSNEASEVVLTNDAGNPDAEIFYTIDESPPARAGAGNPGSQRYLAPFAVEDGTIVRWACYQNDWLPSRHQKSTVTVS
jgi:hypothetical protein